ncbi:MAG: M20/M25/M40 family metallo-hydrolase [Anaerolineales bacterium]
MKQKLSQLAAQIQQIPAPTFHEEARAAFVREKFAAEGLSDITQDSAGNVFARLKGGNAVPLIVSAHLDTVFPAESDLALRRDGGRLYGPGLGDNALGVAALFGLLWRLRAARFSPPGDLWLVANSAEEGLGDLKGMQAVCERFGGEVRAYLILEGLALGHIYHRAIGVRRYKIICHARGGHSWADYGKPSAIHELAGLITRLTALTLPKSPRTTLNVGRIGGGTSVNSLAAEAWLELDLRSEDPSTLEKISRSVEKLIESASQPERVWFSLEVIGQRPAGEISASHPLIGLAQACLREQGLEPVLTSGSTDANIPLSRGFPALVLGVSRGGGAHTLDEFIETEPLEQGLEQIFRFVTRAWD